MNDFIITVNKSDRSVTSKTYIGNDGENLQDKLVFKFSDSFVSGLAHLDYERDGEKFFIPLEKENETYVAPIKKFMLKEGSIYMQLVIEEEGTEVPIFKSDIFTLYCKKSINSTDEEPEGFEMWLEQANKILYQANNVNISAQKENNKAIIKITDKTGFTKTIEILDGKDGKDGASPDLSNYVQKPDFKASQAEQDTTIEGLQVELERYKLLENALPHTENETASDYVTLENTAKAPMKMELIPQTSQDGEPTPDYPQEIHCTTGENTIKVSNTDNSEEKTYPISLGNIEMYNINNIADGFVYDETEDKFYIERKNGKVVLNGSESWNAASDIFYTTAVNDYATSNNTPFSNYFVGKPNIGTASLFKNYGNLVIGFNISNSIPRLFIRYDNMTNVTDFKNWLSTHNATVIYELATSTLEEITDTTLISQLRAIKNALSMQGTTHIISTATGENLPFLIKARAVQTIERT